MADFAVIVREVKCGKLSIAKQAPKMLAFVEKLSEPKELKECKAQAAAVAAYLAQRRDSSVEEYNAAVKIKTRVEHRLGEVLAATVKHGGHNKKQGDSVSPCSGGLPKPITKKQSSRSQQLARIPWQKISERIDAQTEANERASPSRIVNNLLREQRREDYQKPPNAATSLQYGKAGWFCLVHKESWTNKNSAALMEEFGSRPEFAGRKRTLQAQQAELDRLKKEIELLEKRKRKLDDAHREESWAFRCDVRKAIEHEHGRMVCAGWTGFLIRDQGHLEKLRACATPEDQRELILSMTGHCTECEGKLGPEDECPDKPGYYFTVCAWCLEHQAITHCRYCGAPLSPEEDDWCTLCRESTFRAVNAILDSLQKQKPASCT
jgi:hypothetical protein